MDTWLLGFRGRQICLAPGYWGTSVGFYGGINYGNGYFGSGFNGGRWEGNVFRHNTAVTNVDIHNVHNVYEDKTVVRPSAVLIMRSMVRVE